MNRTINSLRNLIFGIIRLVSMILGPFVIRTVLIWKLGNEYVGLNGLFSSIIQILNLAELGMNGNIVYSLYKPLAENDISKINAYLAWIRKFYYKAGGIVTLLGLSIIPFLDKLIYRNNYPENINIYILYLILLIGNIINYFNFPQDCALLVASQRSDYENKFWTYSGLLIYFLQFIALYFLQNYYMYIFIGINQQIIVGILRKHYTKKFFSQFRCHGKLTLQEIGDIKRRVLCLIGHQVNTTVVNGTDSLFLSYFCGLSVVANYSNYFYICAAITSILAIIFSSLTASIGNYIVTADIKENYSVFKIVLWLNEIMVGLCTTMLLCLYQNFINLWLGKIFSISLPTVVFFVIYFYSINTRYAINTYKDACGMWWADKWKPYVSILVNIILDFVLVKNFTINGVILASVISLSIIEIPWETHVLAKCYFKNMDKKSKVHFSKLFCYYFNLFYMPVFSK